MLKDLTLPKAIPDEKSMQQRLLEMYQAAGPMAFTTMFSLLFSPKDEVKFNASKEILNKILPEAPKDTFAFLMTKSEEELIGLISGSGVFDQIKQLLAATNPGYSQDSIVEAAQVRVAEVSQSGDGAARVEGQ